MDASIALSPDGVEVSSTRCGSPSLSHRVRPGNQSLRIAPRPGYYMPLARQGFRGWGPQPCPTGQWRSDGQATAILVSTQWAAQKGGLAGQRRRVASAWASALVNGASRPPISPARRREPGRVWWGGQPEAEEPPVRQMGLKIEGEMGEGGGVL